MADKEREYVINLIPVRYPGWEKDLEDGYKMLAKMFLSYIKKMEAAEKWQGTPYSATAAR